MDTVKTYFYAAFFFVLAYFGFQVYREGRRDERMEREQDALDDVRKAKEIRDEVSSDPYFVDRAGHWVRNKDNK